MKVNLMRQRDGSAVPFNFKGPFQPKIFYDSVIPMIQLPA